MTLCLESTREQPHQQVNNAANEQFEPPAGVPSAPCVVWRSRVSLHVHHTHAQSAAVCIANPGGLNWPLAAGRRGSDEGLATGPEGWMEGTDEKAPGEAPGNKRGGGRTGSVRPAELFSPTARPSLLPSSRYCLFFLSLRSFTRLAGGSLLLWQPLRKRQYLRRGGEGARGAD